MTQRAQTVLLTGATGYIGSRLNEHLLSRTGTTLRVFVRNRRKLRDSIREQVEVAEGDTFDLKALSQALQGVDTAYYLIHSMRAGKDYEDRDRRSAENFRDACIQAGVKRLVYLGGLGVKATASRHLLSRIETGEILSARPKQLQTIWFRAGVIIGSGSASFEIIRNLVQKLPLVITPKWVGTLTQPIAVDDVVSYLSQALDAEIQDSVMVDIGSRAMSFREMLLKAARLMGLKRVLIPVPLLSPRLSSYWLTLFTPVPYQMAAALIEGLKSETIVQNNQAQTCFPQISPVSYEQAVQTALIELENDAVLSRWCDSSGGQVCDIKDQADTTAAVLRDRREFPLDSLSRETVFQSLTSLGGESGWFAYNILWQLRGVIDKLLGGYGLNRGRRENKALRLGDALDFWKVVDIKPQKRLLLLAQMKVPGKAWLEFDLQEDTLVQTAHFHPRGLLGRLYWYAVLPLHLFVFGGLGRKILKQAAALERQGLASHPPIGD